METIATVGYVLLGAMAGAGFGMALMNRVRLMDLEDRILASETELYRLGEDRAGVAAVIAGQQRAELRWEAAYAYWKTRAAQAECGAAGE